MRHLHPYTKFVFSFAVSFLAILLDQPVSLSVLVFFSALLFWCSRPSKALLRLHLFLIATTVWGLIISQGLFYQNFPRTVLFCLLPPTENFSGLCLIKEGLFYGLIQSLRIIAALNTGLYLVTSTPKEDLFRAISSLPLPRGLTLLGLSAVRFLPSIAGDLRLIRGALRLRGYRPFKRGLFYTLRVEFSIIYPLLTKAVRQARTLSDTLLTRGFDPLSTTGLGLLIPWKRREKILSLAVALLCGLVLISKILFWLYLQEVFYAEGLRLLYAFVRHYL